MGVDRPVQGSTDRAPAVDGRGLGGDGEAEVAPIAMKWSSTGAGMVTRTTGAVWKVPPASMFAAGPGIRTQSSGWWSIRSPRPHRNR